MSRISAPVTALALAIGASTLALTAVAQSQEDFMEAMDIIVNMQICEARQPGFKQATASRYAAWRAEHQQIVDVIEAMPQVKNRPEVSETNITPQQRAAQAATCSRLQRLFTQPPPAASFATPEATWEEYLSSLRNGRREAALDCLTNGALINLKEIIETMPADFLRQIATGYEPLRLKRGSGETASYVVTRNGRAGQVDFIRVLGQWKISSAP